MSDPEAHLKASFYYYALSLIRKDGILSQNLSLQHPTESSRMYEMLAPGKINDRVHEKHNKYLIKMRRTGQLLPLNTFIWPPEIKPYSRQ